MRVELRPEADGAIPVLSKSYAPELIGAADSFAVAVYRHSKLNLRVFEAARIATAVINGCAICRAFRSGRDLSKLGIDDAAVREEEAPDESFYEALLQGDYSGLSAKERLAVLYVQKMGQDPQGLAADEPFWKEFKAAFCDAEIVDLTYCAANWIGLGRAMHVLGVDTVCGI